MYMSQKLSVQSMGLEPTPGNPDMNLNHARMPIPPQLQIHLSALVIMKTVRATGLEPARH